MDAVTQYSPQRAALADQRTVRFAQYAIGTAVVLLLLAAAYAYLFPAVRGSMLHHPVQRPARSPAFSHDARFGSRESGYRGGAPAFGPSQLEPAHALPPPPLAPDLRESVRAALLHTPYQQSRRAVQQQRYFGRTESARPESTFIDARGSGSDYAFSPYGAAAVTGADSLPNLQYRQEPPPVDMSSF